MPNYLPGMLEVPMVEGQSECLCGRDDRYYAFGLWTDYCGMSMKELQKYNAYCGEYCDGGDKPTPCPPCPVCPDCPPCPEPPQPQKIVDVITATVCGTSINFAPQYIPTSDLVLTVEYQYTDANNNLVHTHINTVMAAGTNHAAINIVLPAGATALSVLDITVSPDEDDYYYYVIERRDIDPSVRDAFRFDFVEHSKPDSELLTPEFVATLIAARFRSNRIEMDFCFGQPDEGTVLHDYSTYRDLVLIPGFNNMDDDEADELIVQYSYDMVFAIDTDISRYQIVDALGYEIQSAEFPLRSLGQVVYNGETYNIVRYANPTALSVAADADRPVKGVMPITCIKN